MEAGLEAGGAKGQGLKALEGGGWRAQPPAPTAPPAPFLPEGWRDGALKALGAIRHLAQLGRRAKKFKSDQPLISCLERFRIECVRRSLKSLKGCFPGLYKGVL